MSQRIEFLDRIDRPLPSCQGQAEGATGDWKKIPIRPVPYTEDPLVIIPNTPVAGRASAWPCYYKNPELEAHRSGFGELAAACSSRLAPSPLVFARQSVVGLLDRAQQLLDSCGFEDLQLVVADGYRPMAVQRALYATYRAWVAKNNPTFSDEEVDAQTSKMVAYPPTDERQIHLTPPNHLTGGAVDVVLARKKLIDVRVDDWLTHAVIDFGSEFDEMMHPEFGDKRSETVYFEHADLNLNARANRRLLQSLMRSVGFTGYAAEWWHFQSGNQLDAHILGLSEARYGAITSEYDSVCLYESLKRIPNYERFLVAEGLSASDARIQALADFGLAA